MVLYGTCKKTPLSQVDYGDGGGGYNAYSQPALDRPPFSLFLFPRPFWPFCPRPLGPSPSLAPSVCERFSGKLRGISRDHAVPDEIKKAVYR